MPFLVVDSFSFIDMMFCYEFSVLEKTNFASTFESWLTDNVATDEY